MANTSGQVGRNYMAHVATQVWGRFEAVMGMNRGYPSSLITEDMLRPDDATFAGGYLVQSLGVLPVTLATGLTRGGALWGQRLVDRLDDYQHLAGIGINGECLRRQRGRCRLPKPRHRQPLDLRQFGVSHLACRQSCPHDHGPGDTDRRAVPRERLTRFLLNRDLSW